MNNSSNKKQTTSGKYYNNELVVEHANGRLHTEKGFYGEGAFDLDLFSDDLIEKARENLGVQEMFKKPLAKRWEKTKKQIQHEEDWAYDEGVDDKMSVMTDEDINLSNNND